MNTPGPSWENRAPVRARWRLVVIQVLVLALLVSLFGRLWWLQVVSSEQFQQAAVQNRDREVLVPALRGTIVDDKGRTLAGNRVSLVVTVDRAVLTKLPAMQSRSVLGRLAKVLDRPYAELAARLRLCGEPGASKPPVCWNGSPYQPIPVAEDVDERVAIAIMERREDFPGIVADTRALRAYPARFGTNAAHLLGYLSPITTDELGKLEDPVTHRSDLVGRAGLERGYDEQLSGTPGVRKVTVDNLGRANGVSSETAPVAGSYVADSGAAVVMDVRTGRVVAMASYPTYDPRVWVGGISQSELDALYSRTALLSRATQGQLAPGSTFKPVTTSGALTNGYDTGTRLDCSSYFEVGNRKFKNYESASHGMMGFADALELSCDTFFYRIAYGMWLREGGNSSDVDARDPLVEMAQKWGLGKPTGIDLPSEASGRIADRRWKKQYYDAMKDYYCKLSAHPTPGMSSFLKQFSREFCVDGWRYRAGDAVNFAIGQGDTTLTPLQLATVYSALANGGTLWSPRVAKTLIAPDGKRTAIPSVSRGRVPVPAEDLRYIDDALKRTPRTGTAAWKFTGFPLDKVPVRAKTGTAERYGKQTTSWLASYTDRYAVVMMISQAGTGSGASGEAVRHIWEGLYGVTGGTVDPRRSVLAR